MMSGVRRHLFEKQSGRCHYCRRVMEKWREGPLLCTVDEKHPRSKGGMRVRSNQVAACKGCNNLKGQMPYEEFLNSQAFADYLARQAQWSSVNKELGRAYPASL